MIESKIVVKWNGRVSEELLRDIDAGLDDVADAILAKATEFVPVDQGMLKKSLHTENEFLHKEVVADSPYAAYVEFGTSPHFPPPDALIGWAKRTMGLKDDEAKKVGWAIARKIAREGTPSQPFMKPATDYVIPKVAEIIRRRTRG